MMRFGFGTSLVLALGVLAMAGLPYASAAERMVLGEEFTQTG